MKTKLTLLTILAAALFGVGCSSLDRGLVAYYPFNGNANDESGNGNDGEVNGTTLVTDRHGAEDKAYSFDGDDLISIGNAITYSDKITVTSWVRHAKKPQLKAYDEWATIVGGPPGDIYFAILKTRLTFSGEYRKPFPEDLRSTTPLSDNKWHQVAASYDGSVAKIFVDGELEDSLKAVGPFSPGEKNIG